MVHHILLTFIIALPQAVPAAQAPQQIAPLTIGETFTLASATMGETRRINVYLPAGYNETAQTRFPVLYMPDGGMAEDFLHVAGLVQVLTGNGTMRPFILVGIENTVRRRDLSGPTENAEDRKMAPRRTCARVVIDAGHSTWRRAARATLMARSRGWLPCWRPTEVRSSRRRT